MNSDVNIQAYVPSHKDYQRVDDRLTAYSKYRGGVDYSHVTRTFQDSDENDENPKLEVTADFLSWGCVTLTDISILDQSELTNLFKAADHKVKQAHAAIDAKNTASDNFANSVIKGIAKKLSPNLSVGLKTDLAPLHAATAKLLHKVRKVAEDANMASIVVESSYPQNEPLYLEAGFLKSADVPHMWDKRKNFYMQTLPVTGDVRLPAAQNDNKNTAIAAHSKEFGQGFKALDNDGNLMGELIALYNPMGELEIERIYLDDTYRGKGIGRKLVEATESFARKFNMRSIIVASPTWQQGFIDRNGGFYEKVGYQRLIAIPLNLTREFNNRTQYNVYYKKELGTTGMVKYDPAHMFF